FGAQSSIYINTPSIVHTYPLTLHDALPILADEVRRVVNVELLHQAATVEFGGFHADVQHFGDLLGRFPFSHELQDLAFPGGEMRDRKSTRLNSSHVSISYAVFCLKKKKIFYVSTLSIKISEKPARTSI